MARPLREELLPLATEQSGKSHHCQGEGRDHKEGKAEEQHKSSTMNYIRTNYNIIYDSPASFCVGDGRRPQIWRFSKTSGELMRLGRGRRRSDGELIG